MRGLIFGECKDKRSTGYDGDITTEGAAFDDEGNVDVELLNRQFTYIRERMNVE